MKVVFNNHDELDAFIRLLQEIVLTMETELMAKTDAYERYEIEAKIELIEELYPKVAKKQFNSQKKNSVNITKAVAIIIFQYREIAIDIYAEMLKNRIVQEIHREMV
jgi:hypothetical protein